MNITISLNEQTSAKVLEALAKVLSGSASNLAEAEQVQILQKANAALQDKLAQLEQQLTKLQAQTPAAQPAEAPSVSATEPLKPQAQPEQTNPQESAAQTQPDEQAAEQPDPEKAEQWVKEHMFEWLDAKVPFGKAGGRTWRQLAQNQGEKILVKGKAAAPRAYLHALEAWPECNLWAKLKAKAALEYGKNGNGTHHHNN